jgi:hypothetical protein
MASPFWHRFARRLFGPARPARRRPAGAPRPRLEGLEERTLPATVFWANAAGGDWSAPGNWSTGALPGAGDDVVLDVPGNVTVTHSFGTDAVHSLVSQDRLELSGGALDLATASTFNGAFAFTGGTLSGSGDVTVNGPFTWNGGTLRGAGRTVANGGLALIIPELFQPGKVLDGRELDNAGAAVWTGGSIAVNNGGRLDNLAGATFDAESDANFTGSGALPGTFVNDGTFHKLHSGGTTASGVAFHNNGLVDVQTGTLSLNAGGEDTGAFVVEARATLDFNGGTTNLRGTSSVGGGGTVLLTNNAAVNVLGAYVVDSTDLVSGTINFAHDATLNYLGVNGNFSGGALTDPTLTGLGDVTVDTMSWTWGVLSGPGSTTVTHQLDISGPGFKALFGRTLNNAGTATWTGADLGVVFAGVINNLPGATFNDLADASVGGGFGSSGSFNNAGLFVRSVSGGRTGVGIAFNNSGVVDVQTGTLTLGTFLANSVSGGTFLLEGPSTGLFFEGPFTLTPASTVTGLGNVRFAATVNVLGSFTPGSVTIDGTTNDSAIVNFGGSADVQDFDFTGGTVTGSGVLVVEHELTWTGGVMSGPGVTVSNGTLRLSNVSAFTPTVLDGRCLVNGGSGAFTGTRAVTLRDSAVLDNLAGATFLLAGTGTLDAPGAGGSFTGPSGALRNEGDLRKTSGGTSAVTAVFDNAGSAEVQAGTLNLAGGGDGTGSMSVSVGAILQFSGFFVYNLHASSSVDGAGTVQFTAPSLIGTNNATVAGSYTVASTVISAGSINFASDVAVSELTLSGGALTGAGDLTVTNLLNWTGGAMSGPGRTIITNSMKAGGGNGKALTGRTLRNAGTVFWSSTGGLAINNGAVLDNAPGATFSLQAATAITQGGSADVPGTFVNEGTLRKQSLGTTTIAIPFFTGGTVEVQSGTLSFPGTYTQTAGITRLSGGTLSAGGGVNLEGGTLSGTGAVNGNVTNSGLVSPGGAGAAGTLTIDGDYTQTGTGVLLIDLGGLGAGTDYDQLVVSGRATLGGTLLVKLIGGFQPQAGDAFAIVTYGSHSGTFTTLDFPPLGDDLTLSPDYGSTVLTLQTM